MQLIFDTNMLNNAMKEIGYDARKMPLGKLGDSTINEVYNFNKAYLILNKLLQEVEKKKSDSKLITELNNSFYSLIPHDFGFTKMITHKLSTSD